MYRHASTSFFLAALLASISIAAPLDHLDHSKVKRVYVTGNSRHGPAALDRTYKKYGWTRPDGLPDVLEKGKSIVSYKVSTSDADPVSEKPASGRGVGRGKVSATLSYHNSQYLSPVTVGGQKLDMQLDTGSSDFWLFSTSLPEQEGKAHTIYDPAKSDGYRRIDQATFKLRYGDDTTLSGDVGADTVEIGGISVKNHVFAMPTEVSDGIHDNPADGIVGLGFQTMNSICRKDNPSAEDPGCPQGSVADARPTWFENAKRTLQHGVFTINMKPGVPGYYEFGSVDTSAAQGKIKYTPVDSSKGFWQFSSSGYKVGNGKTASFENQTAIADSGSSLLMLEPEVVEAYYAAVPGAEQDSSGYSFPCDTKLPDFHIALGSSMGEIAGDIINYEPNPDGKTCYGGIQAKGGDGFQVFGDIMFNAQFVVFDYDNMRIGFAPHS